MIFPILSACSSSFKPPFALGSEFYYMQMMDSDTDESDNADDLILGKYNAG